MDKKLNIPDTNAPDFLQFGDSVSHYTIEKKIGMGGMGEVYLAHDSKLDRKVAIKFLLNEFRARAEYRQKFIREARAAARLNHPNIITIYEVGEYRESPYFVMEYVAGAPLNKYSSERQLSLLDISDLGIQISSGLAAAHESGIIHRDLKPGNIMIDRTGKARILDFGLASFDDTNAKADPDKTMTRITASAGIAGTVPYMAPEQLGGKKALPQSDIFALGVILYELVCGKHPFEGTSAADVGARILRDQPEPVSEQRMDAPYDLVRIIRRCLEKDPRKRIQTALDVMNELNDLVIRGMSSVVSPSGSGTTSSECRLVLRRRFVLTADLVRRLKNRSPKMIGDHMTYLMSGVESETLVVFVHGLGLDESIFSDTLRNLSCCGVAPSLYGWSSDARYRPALTIEDHSTLLGGFVETCRDIFKPKNIILAGFSSGSDQIMNMLSTGALEGIDIAGLLLIGCTMDLDGCFVSRRYAGMTPNDEAKILEKLREFSDVVTSLPAWLSLHEYIVKALGKFGTEIGPIKQYGLDIMRPFLENDSDQFISWYKLATDSARVVRFVFGTDEFDSLDKLLSRHLEEGVLGDKYREETIIRENTVHVRMADPHIILPKIEAIIELIKS